MSHLYDYRGPPRGLGEHLENMIISFKETRIQWTPPYGHLVNTVTSLLWLLLFVPAKRLYIFTGGTPEKLGGGVRPSFQNPYTIHDQNLQYSLQAKFHGPLVTVMMVFHCIVRIWGNKGYINYLLPIEKITISGLQRSNQWSQFSLFKCRVILSSQKLIFPNGMVTFWSNNWPGARNRSW